MGVAYQCNKRECQFTKDLLMLKVPELFLVQEKTADLDRAVILQFKTFIRNYIVQNGCKAHVYGTLMVGKRCFHTFIIRNSLSHDAGSRQRHGKPYAVSYIDYRCLKAGNILTTVLLFVLHASFRKVEYT